MSKKFVSYRDESRTNYGKYAENGDGRLTIEQINTGAFLRIADQLEAIVQDLESLVAFRTARYQQFGTGPGYLRHGFFSLLQEVIFVSHVVDASAAAAFTAGRDTDIHTGLLHQLQARSRDLPE